MCSLQEHIERDIRARAAAAAAAKTPAPEPGIRYHDAIHAAVMEQLRKKNAHIEASCQVALILDCGVRVKTYADGSYTVAVDPEVPAATIYEERPDQPTYGMSFEED